MTTLLLAGPSYSLRNRKADCQRRINWFSCGIESGTGKGGAAAYLKQVPGKRQLAGCGSVFRGLKEANDSLYAVVDDKLFQISSTWSATELGTLATVSGPVRMKENTTQLCVTDGPNGYVWDFEARTFATITSGAWLGSNGVDTLDGYGIFSDPDTSRWYISANQDFLTLNALQFASAEGAPGDIVAFIVKHRELILMQTRTSEVWYNSGGADFTFARNDGAAIEVGCAAPYSLVKMAGVAVWLGRDEDGAGIVFAMQGYVPERISNFALEEQLGALTEAQIYAATAYTYHQEGQTFYCLNVPGLATTWVYELSTKMWHERGEYVGGVWQQDIATCHAYAYGKHVVGGSNGVLYQLDPTYHQGALGELVRELISPHNAQANGARVRFGSVQIDCNVGSGKSDSSAAQIMLRSSNDGGLTYGNWRYLSLGAVGEYQARARATMLGSAKDRVWQIRCTDPVRAEPISMLVNEV